jgi:hypothetical protein
MQWPGGPAQKIGQGRYGRRYLLCESDNHIEGIFAGFPLSISVIFLYSDSLIGMD